MIIPALARPVGTSLWRIAEALLEHDESGKILLV
jgi:hypothetical protein